MTCGFPARIGRFADFAQLAAEHSDISQPIDYPKGSDMGWFRRRPLTPAEIADRQARLRERRERERAQAAEAARHECRLEIAIGIGSVKVIAHNDTWSTMEGTASRYTLWPKTRIAVAAKADGMVEVCLGGRHILALLHSMRHLSDEGRSPVDRAVGRRIYTELARTVDAVTNPGAPVPPIVLDTRLTEPAS